MKWHMLTRDEKIKRDVERYCKWHRWFAWYPVPVYCSEQQRHINVWLTFVGRKKKIMNDYTDGVHLVNCRFCMIDDLLVRSLHSPEIVDSSNGAYERLLKRLEKQQRHTDD
jgi:hypothetical protein